MSKGKSSESGADRTRSPLGADMPLAFSTAARLPAPAQLVAGPTCRLAYPGIESRDAAAPCRRQLRAGESAGLGRHLGTNRCRLSPKNGRHPATATHRRFATTAASPDLSSLPGLQGHSPRPAATAGDSDRRPAPRRAVAESPCPGGWWRETPARSHLHRRYRAGCGHAPRRGPTLIVG